MKNKYLNILLGVMSVALAVGLFVIGVIAATQINATISGTFFFNVPSDAFFASIEAEITGYQGEDKDSEEDKISKHFIYNEETSLEEEKAYFPEWKLNTPINLKEDENGQPAEIVFTFTIKNQNEEKAIQISFMDNTTSQGGESQIDIEPDALFENDIVLTSLMDSNYVPDEVTFTIRIVPKSGLTSISETFNFSLIFNFV